jgi:hypothetical protein
MTQKRNLQLNPMQKAKNSAPQTPLKTGVNSGVPDR